MRDKKLLSAAGVCLSLALLSSSALAEDCVSSPDCQAMGYKEASCSDGGVKCPWGNYWFCGAKKDVCQSCKVGYILNSDMTCSQSKTSSKTPIGVVADQVITNFGTAIKCQGVAVALNDIGQTDWNSANSQCDSYSAGGLSGWHLPTMEELTMVYGNISSVQNGLTAAGGTTFVSTGYWVSSVRGNPSSSVFDPIIGSGAGSSSYNDHYVRPVLDLTGLQ